MHVCGVCLQQLPCMSDPHKQPADKYVPDCKFHKDTVLLQPEQVV